MNDEIAALASGLPVWLALTMSAAMGQSPAAQQGRTVAECALPNGSSTKAGAEPVAIIAGQPVYARDLDSAAQSQILPLRNQEYQIRSRVLDDLIRRRILEAEAKKRGLTVEQLYVEDVDSKIATPTDREVAAYYVPLRSQLNKPLEEIKNQLRTNLKAIQTTQARQDYAEFLRNKAEVAVLLHPPKFDVAFDRTRLRGDLNAPITIVEFADYQCPYCQQTEATLSGLLKKYPGKVNVAFRDFPLGSIHPYAQKASEATRCAGRQGKFWEFHDALFVDQSKLDQAGLNAAAQKLGLDEKAFQSCLASGEYSTQIARDVEDGRKVGVGSTPAFFVNGIFLSGAQPQTAFEKLIEDELKAARDQSPAISR